jgi:hypothetical protein
MACPQCGQAVQLAAGPVSAAAPRQDPMAPIRIITQGPATPRAAPREAHDSPQAGGAAPATRSWGRYAAMGVGVVLLAGLVWAGLTYGLPALRSTSGSGSSKASSEPTGAKSPEGWADARSKTLRSSAYEVSVTRVQRGPVLGRNASAETIELDPDALLIFLRVKNISGQNRPYQSWYAASSKEGGKIAAELTDDRGLVYPLEYFAGTSRLRGHTASASLPPSQRVEDILVFDIPAEANLDGVSYWQLRLDGQMLGWDEPFRFAIDKAMLTSWDPPSAATPGDAAPAESSAPSSDEPTEP